MNLKKNNNTSITVELHLPKRLEQHLTYLEEVSKRSKNFIIREALIQYLEHAEDVSKISEREKLKGNKYYTTEELLEHLNLKEEYSKWEQNQEKFKVKWSKKALKS